MTDPKDAERLAEAKIYMCADRLTNSATLPPKTQTLLGWIEAALSIIDKHDATITRLIQERDELQARCDINNQALTNARQERDEARRSAEALLEENTRLHNTMVAKEIERDEARRSAEALERSRSEWVSRYRAATDEADSLYCPKPSADPHKQHPLTGDTWTIDGNTGRTKEVVPRADDVERAREIVEKFPVQEEFDAKQCLIEQVSDALTAARREERQLRTLEEAVPPDFIYDPVRIWSGEHNAYWRSNAQGYTVRAAAAWLLSRAEAESRTGHCGPEKMIDIQEASDITAARREERERCALLLDERAIDIRDNSPRGPEGLLTALAGAHVGALFDAAAAIRARSADSDGEG